MRYGPIIEFPPAPPAMLVRYVQDTFDLLPSHPCISIAALVVNTPYYAFPLYRVYALQLSTFCFNLVTVIAGGVHNVQFLATTRCAS